MEDGKVKYESGIMRKESPLVNSLFVLSVFTLYALARLLMMGEESWGLYFLVSVVLYIVVIFLLGGYRKNYTNLGIFFSLLFVFQNIIIGLGLNFKSGNIDYTSIQYVIALTSLFGFLVIFFLWFNSREKITYQYEKIGIALIISVIAYTFIGSLNIMISFAYARNLFLIVITVFIGKYMIRKESNMYQLVNYIFAISLALTIFGFIERFFFNVTTWNTYLNLYSVLMAKGLGYSGSLNGLPDLFYTSILDKTFRRTVSFFMEPVNLSYFLSASVILSFVLKKRMLFVIFTVSNILTFGKGGLMVTVISLLFIIILQIKDFQRKNGFIWVFLGSLAALLIISFVYFKITPGTALPHLWGLMSIENNLIINPMGNGLGSGGNFASLSGEHTMDLLETGAESGIATLAYKMGIIGVGLYISYFLALGSTLYKISIRYKGTFLGKLALGTTGLLLGLLYGSAFQENPLGPQTNHLILLLSGAVVAGSVVFEKNYNIKTSK